MELAWAGEPLFLMMAGLMAAQTGSGGMLALGRTDIALRLAERVERERLKSIVVDASQARTRAMRAGAADRPAARTTVLGLAADAVSAVC
jgi:hypothetical protein